MKRLMNTVHRILPRHAVLPLLLVVVVNFSCYIGSRMLPNWFPLDLAIFIDDMTPLIPSSVYVYLLCYVTWVVNYIMIARESKEVCCRFVAAEVTAKIICGIFFCVLHTYAVRPEITGNLPSEFLLRIVYELDAADNLFPSVHCLVSYFCWRGLLWCPSVGRGYRTFSLVAAILVFLSTVLTKQHVFLDIIGAVAVAEFSIWLSKKCRFERLIEKISPKPKKEENYGSEND